MTEPFEPREAPDWPSELDEPISKLGPPLAVFRVPQSRAARKVFIGIALLVAGIVGNYLYWGVFNGPIEGHFVLLLLFTPIATGLGFIYAAWRDRGLWVLIYPVGLLRWQRGEIVTFPWDEVTELAFYRVTECDRPRRTTGPDGELQTCWLPIAKADSSALGAHLILRRADGAEAIVPTSFDNFPKLCKIVQEETFSVMWPKTWARFVDGQRVRFGEVSLSLSGIHRDGEFLPWYEMEDALVQNGKLQIRSRHLSRPWADVPLNFVSNPHVFIALLIVGPPPVPEAERA